MNDYRQIHIIILLSLQLCVERCKSIAFLGDKKICHTYK